MIKKICKIVKLSSKNSDYDFWKEKSSEERLSAVEILRRQYFGNTERFQRVIRVTKQK